MAEEFSDKLYDLLRQKLDLPADTTTRQVMSALDTHILRRAIAVGLPSDANLNQVTEAEKAVAVKAAAAAKERRVAASQMLGHQNAADEPLHPSLRPVSERAAGNRSNAIDWSLVMDGDE